jgi:phage minor structural protein
MSNLIHILDAQTDQIIGVLTTSTADYWNDERTDSLENKDTFDFIANAQYEKSMLLQNRNRIVLQDEDGIFREYIINYAEQYSRLEKDVRSDASWKDLEKANVLQPQTLVGATAYTATQTALQYTEWSPGNIDFGGSYKIVIDDFTDPLTFLNTISTTFGLEISYRVEISGNKITGRYVDMLLPDNLFDGKEIVFGKDLKSIKRKEDGSTIVTALMGLGPVKEDGSRLVYTAYNQDAKLRWGRNNFDLIQTYEPQSENTDMDLARLTTLTETELQKRIDSIVTYECEAASIEQVPGLEHEKIRKGATLRIKDDGYQPPLYVEARITEVKRQQSTGKINSFQIGNFRTYSQDDLLSQIDGLKQDMLNRIKKMLTSDIKASAGNVFKNNTGSTNLTARAFISGQEVDTNGSLYTYSWIKLDKAGAQVAGYSKATKTITVTAAEVTDANTFICTITTTAGIATSPQITITDVLDGPTGPSMYSWIKYADGIDGSGISDSPTGKRYLGLAVNKSTATESTLATDYTWSPLYDNVQVGARNLYLDSYLKRGLSYSSVATLTRTDKSLVSDSETNLIKMAHNGVAGDSSNFGFRHTTADQLINITSGKKYTLSFKARGNVTNFSYTYFMRSSAEGSNSSVGTTVVTLNTTNWTDVVIYKDGPFDTTTGYILIGSTDGGSGKWFEVKEVKLEQGNISTDFTPALEDTIPITAVLSNDTQTIPTLADGTGGNYAGATSTLYMYNGAADDTANWTVTASPSTGVTGSLSGKTYTVTDMTVDSGYVDFAATRTGFPSVTKRFTLTKAKQGTKGNDGGAGTPATAYWLMLNAPAISKSLAGAYTPASITATGMSQTGTNGPAVYAARFIIAESTDGSTFADKYTSAANESVKTYTPTAGIKSLRVRMYLAGGTTTLLDEQVISIVSDGPQGGTGAPAITGVLSNESAAVSADNAGTVSSFTGATTTMYIYEGPTDVSSSWAVTAGTPSGLSGSLSGKTYTVSGMSADTGYVDLTATRSGYSSITKRFTVTKAKAGIQGQPGGTGGPGPTGPQGDPGVDAITGYFTNPYFRDWPSTYPTEWTLWTTGPTKETTITLRGGNAVRFTTDAATGRGLVLSPQKTNVPLKSYFVLELDVYIVSATSLNGAGVLVDFYYNASSYNRISIALKNELPTTYETGKWYSIRTLIDVSSLNMAAITKLNTYLMGNYNTAAFGGALDVKDIIYGYAQLREATEAEIYGYQIGTVVDSWKGAAVGSTTYINGGLIETNTILTNKIAVGDFTNYVDDPTFTLGAYKPIAPWSIVSNIARVTGGKSLQLTAATNDYPTLKLTNASFPVKNGDIFYVEFWAYRNSATQNININIAVQGYDSTWDYDSDNNPTAPATATNATWIKYSSMISVTKDGNAQIEVKMPTAADMTGSWNITDVIVRRAMTGEMIVDGSITARHVQTGSLTWDKAQGGTLKLGGANNQNGVLSVYDSSGDEVTTIDGDKGGFETLNVGTLNASNIQTVNQNSYSLYVDPTTGDDDFDGLTTGTSKRSIQAALDSIPKLNYGTVTIVVSGGNIYEAIYLENFHGTGSVIVDFQSTSNVLNGYINFRACTNYLEIRNGVINSGNASALTVDRCIYTFAQAIDIYGKADGIFVKAGSNLFCYNIESYVSGSCFVAQTGGYIMVSGCLGKGSNYGLYATNGGAIKAFGSYPGGTIANTSSTNNTDNISLSGSVNLGSATPATPAAPPTTITTWSSTSSDNVATIYSGWQGGGARQGNYGYGRRTGYWFFGTALSTAVTGKTIKQIRVYLSRPSKGGSSGPVQLQVRWHTLATKPTTAPTAGALSTEVANLSLAWGASGWVTLPSSFITYFANGSAKGIGIYVASDSSSYYAIIDTVAKIEVTYS